MSGAGPQLTAHRTRRWWAVALVLAIAGAACIYLGISSLSGPSAKTASASTTPVAVQSAEPSVVVQQAEPEVSRPVHLDIPAIGVATDLARLGLQADRTVEVPQNPDLAGWFELGPRPGGLGSSVILGHVDSVEGPAVFADLKTLRRGEHVVVRRDDGSSVTFRVTGVETFANADFPAERVYGYHGGRRLNLVTCGGVYDGSNGGYQSNVVVFARWLSETA